MAVTTSTVQYVALAFTLMIAFLTMVLYIIWKCCCWIEQNINGTAEYHSHSDESSEDA